MSKGTGEVILQVKYFDFTRGDSDPGPDGAPDNRSDVEAIVGDFYALSFESCRNLVEIKIIWPEETKTDPAKEKP